MKPHFTTLFIIALFASIIVAAQPNVRPIGQILYETPDDTMGSFANGILFKDDLEKPIVDFAKPGDKMVHVSTFCIIDDIVYCTYYANTVGKQETPAEQLARFVTCPLANPQDKTYHDLCWTQTVAKAENREEILINGKHITHLYDIVLLRKDDKTLYLAWTLALDGEYYRVYRTYDVQSKTFSDIKINQFTVNGKTVDFRTSAVTNLLKEADIQFKPMQGDIGIMQKLSKRTENGIDYYYTGCYCGPFNCLMKSRDLVNWEFVSIPDFPNDSQWENAVYVKGDRAYYCCRQYSRNNTAFLTYYDLLKKTWHEPVWVYETQSRYDFIEWQGNLYMVHSPKDRYHLAIMKIDQSELSRSYDVQCAWVIDSFYPFMQEYKGKLYMSFTQSRKHIWLSNFRIRPLTTAQVINKFRKLLED